MRAALVVALLSGCTASPWEEKDKCDVTAFVDECEALGMPHDFGVAWGCYTVKVPIGTTFHGFKSCEDAGHFKCCVGKP